MKKLGVIGGMGAAASALFYENITKLTKAEKDQDHIPMVILSDSQMPDRTAALLGSQKDREKVFTKMLDDARYLRAGGCDAMVMTCNTAHYFADRLERESRLKLFNMLRLTAAEAACVCKKKKNNKVMLLATDGTARTKVYQTELEALGLETMLPKTAVQKKLMSIIYDTVKAGKTVTQRSWNAIDKACKDAGACCAILGCTELSVVKAQLNLPAYYIDAMDVLARHCVKEFEKK